MSNPDTFDPNDESWLEMPLVVSPLQIIDPSEIVEIEDDSPFNASAQRRESEDTLAEEEEKKKEEEEEEEEEELAEEEEEEETEEQAEEGGENIVEGEAVDTSKVNRALLQRCRNRPSLEEAILFFPDKEMDAPSILKYTPTYQGFIRQKGKKPADTDKPIQQAKTAKLKQQEEKSEEVFEDSFGEILEFLRSSIRYPLRGKIREAIDEKGEEIEMAPRNILADLEKRKNEKEEAEKAKTTSKIGPSAGGPSVRSTRSKGLSIQVPDSPTGKRLKKSLEKDIDLLPGITSTILKRVGKPNGLSVSIARNDMRLKVKNMALVI
ncbi:hypothetical protein RHGRI_017449 [Rhododendron griersonianum]|uniref:Uncharacterized protein n=1 Tax=Rhododendron griersonianum TaxID=479676 RepID=A0AAV6JXW2_9ERIC|nr:hypothetical protein RHGRI_017449 [Rhododendron griersonianum]